MTVEDMNRISPQPEAVERSPKVEIPWEEIDKWIASLSFDEEDEESDRRHLTLDAGVRRN